MDHYDTIYRSGSIYRTGAIYIAPDQKHFLVVPYIAPVLLLELVLYIDRTISKYSTASIYRTIPYDEAFDKVLYI